MLELTLPLPPTTNHGYHLTAKSGKAKMVKTEELEKWELVARLAVATTPGPLPKREPLVVMIGIHLSKDKMRRIDLDGPIKFVVDAVVGARRDQWIDILQVNKCQCEGDGYVDVRVFPKGSLGPG